MSSRAWVQALAERFASDVRDLRTLITGSPSTTDLSGLTTTNKTSVVGAVNELVATKATSTLRRRVARVAAVYSSSVPFVDSTTASYNNLLGQATAQTSFYTRIIRVRVNSTAVVNAVGNIRTGTQHFMSPVAGDGNGFDCYLRFGVAQVSPTTRWFVGFKAGGAALVGTTPIADWTNIFGIGAESADANISLIHNDAAGTATMTDLGASFPAKVVQTHFYELRLRNAPGAGQVIDWTLKRVNDGVTTSGQITTDLPGVTVGMCWQAWVSTGSTAAISALDFALAYVEHEYLP